MNDVVDRDSRKTDHAVVIAGGGPTGLMLAGELALAGVDVAIVERRTSQDLVGSRGSGLHARTIEVLDQRGIADRFLAEGQRHPAAHFHVPLELTDFPTRHNYTLALWQNHSERILAGWVGELAVPIYGGREVTGFAQDDAGVDVEVSDGQPLRARYLVGCDGGRSLVRKAAGIAFPGWDPTMSWLIVEGEPAEEPVWGFRQDAIGTHAIGKLGDGRRIRAVIVQRQVETADEPTLREAREALVAVYGTDFGIHNVTWISRFTDMTRQAAAYRDRRVLLAGDAAHVHPPLGGQGLNIGVQDAVNLGWKLAQVVKGRSPDLLLDTYHAERHPVAARVLRNTMAQVALRRPDDRTKVLGDFVAELLTMPEPRKRFAGMISGLDIHYHLGEGHPLLGRRMPDLDLVTADGPRRVYELLHEARPVLIKFTRSIAVGELSSPVGGPGGFDLAALAPWADRVRVVAAEYSGAWELPVIGPVPAPSAVLVRPDGYVGWAGEGSERALKRALTGWCGLPNVGNRLPRDIL